MRLSDEIISAFIRQRRNLMGSSLTLVAYVQSGLSMEKLTVFGNDFSLSSPAVVERALWVAWGYFLIRYLQHLHDLRDRKIVTSYHARLTKLVKRVAIKLHRQQWERDPQVRERTSLSIQTDSVDVAGEGLRLWRVSIDAHVAFNQSDGSTVSTGGRREIPVAGFDLWLQRLRSVFHVLVKTRLATEYALPLLVAALPPADKILR
jgi:hypothetical protein